MDQRIFVSDLPLLEQPFDPAVLGRPFPESRIDGGKADHFDDHHILAVPLHGLLGLHGIAVDVGCMLYEQLSVLSERIGGGEISLTDSGVQLISFRDYLATVGFRY